MSDFIFCFDLETAILTEEVMTVLAEKTGRQPREKDDLIPFPADFRKNMAVFSDIPAAKLSTMIAQIPVQEKLTDFILRHKDRCFLLTEYPKSWVQGIVGRLGIERQCFSSGARVMDKYEAVSALKQRYVAVGSTESDAQMIEYAEFGIGYEAVHPVASSVLNCATHIILEGEKLCQFLERLL